MDKKYYVPTGQLQGDDHKMGNSGNSTGVTDTYGADIGQSAVNRAGSISGASKSDPAEQCFADRTEGSK